MKLYPTMHHLHLAMRESVTPALQKGVVPGIDLERQAKQARRTLRGSTFIALHELFEDISRALEQRLWKIEAHQPVRGFTMRTNPLALSVLILVASCPLVRAAEAAPAAVHGTWLFSVDNDLADGSDDHYPSGVQVGWVSRYLEDYADATLPSMLVHPLHALPFVNEDARQRFISYSLSHRIFTPNDISDPKLIVDDMPYTGLLFTTFTAGAQDAIRMDAFSLIVGVAGPAALGEHVQKSVHQAIGSAEPRGWAHQIRNEPLFNINYERRWRITTWGSPRAWGGDLIGQTALAVGNLLTNATVGLGGRLGWRVPDDFGLPPQFFGEETIGSRPFSAAAGDRGVWLFALVNGSVFANAIFWDGNTFTESHSIHYDRFIARAYAGVRIRWDRWGASFALVTTTVPWDNPENKSTQRYGRVGITYSY